MCYTISIKTILADLPPGRKDKEVKMLKKSMRVQIIEKCAEPLTNALAQTKDPDEIRRLRKKINELRYRQT